MSSNSLSHKTMFRFHPDYQIIGKLRTGGMGRVYLAIAKGPLNIRQKVVLKLPLNLSEGIRWRKDFENEARVMAQLNHPNIVRSLEWIEMDGSPCMVFEYIEGFEVADILRHFRAQNKRMPLSMTSQIMLQVCEAVQYMHSARTIDDQPLAIVHRDLDPSNIMLTDDGYVKIIDFGIAKNAMQEVMTKPGVYKGKLINLPPDVFLFEKVDHRADIFSLGLLLFEMLTGQRARKFEVTDSLTRIVELLRKRPIPLPSEVCPQIPDVFDHIVAKATASNRDARYQSAAEMFNDLRQVSKSLSVGPNHLIVKRWIHEDLKSLRTRRAEKMRLLLDGRDALTELSPSGSTVFKRNRVRSSFISGMKNRITALKLQIHGQLILLQRWSVIRSLSLVFILAISMTIQDSSVCDTPLSISAHPDVQTVTANSTIFVDADNSIATPGLPLLQTVMLPAVRLNEAEQNSLWVSRKTPMQ
ncbi:MAG: serine/threonine protein kinase [Deltaproteobacteria bacterium]|nr:serine/threonine protein kinase [Deltaproteobacteria bacterium]